MLSWTDIAISQKALKEEIRIYVEFAKELLIETFKEENIDAIYFEGSAQKNWDAPLDYVPHLSDIDIHVRFKNSITADISLDTSIHLQNKIDTFWYSQSRIHYPRLQFTWLNNCEHDEEFIPTPLAETLFGTPYTSITEEQRLVLEPVEKKKLLDHTDFFNDLPKKFPGRPGTLFFDYVRALSWRISSCAPRVLSHLGVSPSRAWSMNRSNLVQELTTQGKQVLAQNYADYYDSCWQYFLTKEQVHLQTAIRAACAVYKESFEIIQSQ